MGDGVPFAALRPDLGAVENAVRRLPPGRLRPGDYRLAELEIFADWDIACHYAPFDHLDRGAAVAVVGINPGAVQAAAAFEAARDALWAGAGWPEASRAAKRSGAFTGPLRSNLVRMLDEIDLPGCLRTAGLEFAGSGDLFSSPAGELHLTYCVRYPVVVSGRDYTGRRPVLMRSPRLRDFVFELVGPELAAVPDAVVIPLGRIAGDAVTALVDAGALDAARCLFGLPHPSGANGHREEDFARGRDVLVARLRSCFEARSAARAAGGTPLESA